MGRGTRRTLTLTLTLIGGGRLGRLPLLGLALDLLPVPGLISFLRGFFPFVGPFFTSRIETLTEGAFRPG